MGANNQADTSFGENEHPMVILQRIFDQDQDQADGHSLARQCLLELRQPQEQFVGSPFEDYYWDAVSREELHIAQAEAQGGNLHIAKEYAELALASAKRAGSDFYAQSDWVEYLEATVAYFSKDLERLRIAVELCKKNRQVAERLLRGIEQNGNVNYVRDY